MRVAAIDFGLRRIGLAVSDERKIFSQPLKPLQAERTHEKTIAALLTLLTPYQPLEKIIIGLPLHMNGKESPMSLEVRSFAEKLGAACNIPVILWDERLTSQQVARTLKEAQISTKKGIPIIDGMAAAALLQSFLDVR